MPSLIISYINFKKYDLKTEELALMAYPSTTLYSTLRCSTNNFCLKNYNYRTKDKPREQKIERKQGMWGLTSLSHVAKKVL